MFQSSFSDTGRAWKANKLFKGDIHVNPCEAGGAGKPCSLRMARFMWTVLTTFGAKEELIVFVKDMYPLLNALSHYQCCGSHRIIDEARCRRIFAEQSREGF